MAYAMRIYLEIYTKNLRSPRITQISKVYIRVLETSICIRRKFVSDRPNNTGWKNFSVMLPKLVPYPATKLPITYLSEEPVEKK